MATQAPGYVMYETKAGDRWDLIAWEFYGDPTEISLIIEANPAVPIAPVLPQGLQIAIPLIVSGTQQIAALQPWLRLAG